MKRLITFLVALLLAAALVATYWVKAETAQSEKTQADGAEEGVGIGAEIQEFVEYATGKTPIKRGEQIKKQIRDIGAERNRQLEEVMSE